MRIAVIPARGGSKRIPRKNIRPFLGRPLILWTLENLINSEQFDRVYVSTDDDEIAQIAARAGGAVPFLRDQSLADDFTGTDSVVIDFLEQIREREEVAPSEVCVAYPAAVGMTTRHLVASLNLLSGANLDLVFSGVRYPAPIERAWEISEVGLATMMDESYRLTRTQDLEARFYDAGQIYWWGPNLIRKKAEGEPYKVGIYEVSRLEAVDIDSVEDWEAAEALFKVQNPDLDSNLQP